MSENKLTAGNQFYHVYRLPEKLSDGFCHGMGNPITFMNVDWFAYTTTLMGSTIEITESMLTDMLKKRVWYRKEQRFLVIGSPGLTFVIEPEIE